MALTPEQISRIRNRDPGWERDWGQLYLELQAHLDRIVPRFSGIDWPSSKQVEVEDFVAKMMADYNRRAYNGTLLVRYHAAEGTDVVQFLASKEFVWHRAITHVRRIPVHVSLGPPDVEGGDGGWEPPAPAPHTSLGLGWDQVMCLAEEDLVAVLSMPRQVINQNLRMAGIQLWPRLNWSCPELESLLSKTMRWIGDQAQLLGELHEEARARFEEQIDSISVQRYNGGRGVGPVKDRELEAMQTKLSAQMYFCPLESEALARLFNVSGGQRNSVIDKPLSRYYEARPKLFPTLYWLFKGIERRCYGGGHEEDDVEQEEDEA